MLVPADTLSPFFVFVSHFGIIRHTCEPNNIFPILCPFSIFCPSSMKSLILRARIPAISTTLTGPILLFIVTCAFSFCHARLENAGSFLPRSYFISVTVPSMGDLCTCTSNGLRNILIIVAVGIPVANCMNPIPFLMSTSFLTVDISIIFPSAGDTIPSSGICLSGSLLKYR